MAHPPNDRTRGAARGLAVVTILATVLSGPSVLPAQVSPNGGEFRVNSYTTGHQTYPAVAADDAGGFVVAWASDGSSGDDTGNYSIQMRRFDRTGVPLGADFQVNTYVTGNQGAAAVAVDGTGRFVVAWQSPGSSEGDISNASVQARRFGADGSPLGDQFQVNTYTTLFQGAPEVAADAEGNFVIVWQSGGSKDDSTFSIQGQRYDANGVPEGQQFQVNTYTTGNQTYPAIAAAPGAGFVVVWQSVGSSQGDTSSLSIQGQRYAANGLAQGSQFQVNDYTTGAQGEPSVAVDDHGGFVVTWQSSGSGEGDSDGYSIQARRFEADGDPVAGQFRVNTATTGDQVYPSVAVEPEGAFVVAWQGDPFSGGVDDDDPGVRARRFDAAGDALGAEFEVNSYTTLQQQYPAVAMDGSGNFVVTWYGYGAGDTASFGVHAQRFDALFRDGFEGGSTNRWSDVLP